MTETLVESGAGVVVRRSAKHLRWIVAAVVAVVLGVIGLVTLRNIDHRYGPLENGDFGGLYSLRNFVFSNGGSSERLAATPSATGELIATIRNDGSHSVKITSIDGDRATTNIRWSTYRLASDGNIEGAHTPWRGFPAIVPAGSIIRLLITIHHPAACSRDPHAAASFYAPFLDVHWESLLHKHVTMIDDGIGPAQIRVC